MTAGDDRTILGFLFQGVTRRIRYRFCACTCCHFFTSILKQSLLIQVVDIFIDMPGQFERMISDQLLGMVWIPVLNCLDNSNVVNNRTRDPISILYGACANRAHMEKQLIGHLRDQS